MDNELFDEDVRPTVGDQVWRRASMFSSLREVSYDVVRRETLSFGLALSVALVLELTLQVGMVIFQRQRIIHPELVQLEANAAPHLHHYGISVSDLVAHLDYERERALYASILLVFVVWTLLMLGLLRLQMTPMGNLLSMPTSVGMIQRACRIGRSGMWMLLVDNILIPTLVGAWRLRRPSPDDLGGLGVEEYATLTMYFIPAHLGMMGDRLFHLLLLVALVYAWTKMAIPRLLAFLL